MQPLATTQLMMTWLSMYPADESTTTSQQKRIHIAHTLAVLIINVGCLLASLAYCLEFFSIDFDGAALAFMIAVGEFGLIYFMIVAILMRQDIVNIFTSLSMIYKSNEDEMTYWYLIRANNTSEWMWTFYLKYIEVSLAAISLPVLYYYVTRNDLNVAQFYRPGKFVLPWNQTTIVGYVGEICTTVACGYGYLTLNGPPLLLFISLCIHHQAFLKIFKHLTADKSDDRFDSNKQLCNLIHFHISAKDWFLQSAHLYSSFVLIQLISSAIILAVCVFYLDLQWQQFDFTVITVICSTLNGISALFIYCYFGKLATESYEMMPDCVYNMDWCEYPKKLQKYFVLMIGNMQKSVY